MNKNKKNIKKKGSSLEND